MSKIVFSICIITLLGYSMHAQNFQWGRFDNNTFTFNNIHTATSSDVTSNYGPRNASGGTRFHRGVDISPIGIQNVILAAPRAGAITDIVNPGSGSIKILEILLDAPAPDPNIPNQNLQQTRFRFLHIFTNGNLPRVNSGFRLQEVNGVLVIIDLVNCRAFSTIANIPVTCNGQPISPNNQAILTVNRFEANWPIAPMGSSGQYRNEQGDLVSYSYHTHVSQLENGSHNHNSFHESINAFHDLRIAGVLNNMDCRIRSRAFAPPIDINHGDLCEHINNGQWNSFTPNYGNNTRTVVEAEVYLNGADSVPDQQNPNQHRLDRYSNGFFNESLIEIQIAKDSQASFQLIQGRLLESKFRIDPRGANVVYPDRLKTLYGGTNELESSCNPYAYTSSIGFHPHDYYLTPDFYLRIRQDHVLGNPLSLANYPWDARYQDGDYLIRAKVTNIDGIVRTQNPPVLFDIDNFKPLVREVEVKFDQIGVTVYKNKWNETTIPSQLKLGTRLEGGLPNLNPGPLTVYAVLSESMQNVRAQIPSLSTPMINGTFNSGTEKWSFEFGNVLLAYDECHKIIFKGEDKNGNELLDFQVESPGIPSNCNWGITKTGIIPKRTSATPDAWDANTPSGKDEVHRFRIQQCLDCDGFKVDPPLSENTFDCAELAQSITTDIHFASSPQSGDGSVLIAAPGYSDICVTWYDVNHNEIYEGPELSGVLAGWYCYRLKKECCEISDCIEIGVCDLSANPTLSHPSAGVSDGQIDLLPTGGAEPLNFIWSNGSTSSTISNLDVGTYTVTITDAYYCSAVSTSNLINCPPITVTANASITFPSACDATDGFINLHTNSVNGGTAPYSYHWEDENGNIIVSGAPDLPQLSPGEYCLVAVDALGCTGSKCFDLKPDHFPTIEETILPSCINQSNGSIVVVANSQLPGFYTFLWDDDIEDSGDVYSQRDYLSTGTYCVTITSEVNFCTVTKCFDVPEVTPDGPLVETHTIVNPCSGSQNGKIFLNISGGMPPYTFDWSDVIGAFDPQNRSSIGEGTYTVKIKDYCGAELIKEFTLVPLSIQKVHTTAGCAGQGQAYVTVSPQTGNLPYSVSWSNGAVTENISNLVSGIYCVSVTDAIGCRAINCLNVRNKEYSISVTNSCEGMSDGKITVDIFNPNEQAVEIKIDGSQVYNNLLAPAYFNVIIPSLAAGSSYNLDISIEDCYYNAPPTLIGSQPISKIFDYYDKSSKECVYNDYCNENIIPNSTTIQSPTIDTWNGSGSFFTECKIPIYCPEVTNSVHSRHVNKRTVRAAEYEQILLQAPNFLFPHQLIDSRLQYFYSLILADCDKVRFCPANLRITSVTHSQSPYQQAQNNGEGCFSLDCSLLGNDNFCIHDPGFFPSFFNDIVNGGNVVESCKPTGTSLYQLIIWEEQLKTHFPGIFENSDLYLNYIAPNRTDPRAKCTRIIFCQSDFSVLWWSDINTVSCDDYSNINNSFANHLSNLDCDSYYLNQNGCLGFLCLSPSEYSNLFWVGIDDNNPEISYEIYGHIEMTCPEFPGHFFSSPVNNSLTKNTGTCLNGSLENFGKAIVEGRTTPKGITKCGSNYKFMDYSINSKFDASEDIPDIIHLIDDWDSGQILSIRNLQDQQSYSIDCVGDLPWAIILSSNLNLNVSYFEKVNDEYVIGGEFTGILTLGSTQISTQYTKSGFVIHISAQGVLLSQNIIRNLNSQKPLVFSTSIDGVHIVGQSTSQPLTVDGSVYPIQSGLLTDINLGVNGSNLTSNTLMMDTTLTIVRSQHSLDNSRITYLLRGLGQVHSSDQTIATTGTEDLILVTCSNSGNIIWSEKINGQNIIDQDFDMVYGAGNNLYMGITFHDSLSVQSHISVSNGSSDISLLKFNQIGQLVNLINYGTSDSENVSKMFFADSILYFGGEFSGDTTSRKIGAHTFQTITGTTGTPYISFVTDAFFSQEEARSAAINKGFNSASTLISVHPNPFSNELMLNINSEKRERIYVKIYDGVGHLVIEQSYTTQLGFNDYPIVMQKLPAGIYLIQVLTESGINWIQKIVKE